VVTVRLYRHPRCARFAWCHRALDWLRRFEDSTGTSPVGPLRPGEVVVQDLRRGMTLRGAAAFALLCRQIPAYWPLLPLLRIPALRRRIEREFDGCAGAGCTLD
jgi:hypothetical protein